MEWNIETQSTLFNQSFAWRSTDWYLPCLMHIIRMFNGKINSLGPIQSHIMYWQTQLSLCIYAIPDFNFNTGEKAETVSNKTLPFVVFRNAMIPFSVVVWNYWSIFSKCTFTYLAGPVSFHVTRTITRIMPKQQVTWWHNEPVTQQSCYLGCIR